MFYTGMKGGGNYPQNHKNPPKNPSTGKFLDELSLPLQTKSSPSAPKGQESDKTLITINIRSHTSGI